MLLYGRIIMDGYYNPEMVYSKYVENKLVEGNYIDGRYIDRDCKEQKHCRKVIREGFKTKNYRKFSLRGGEALPILPPFP